MSRSPDLPRLHVVFGSGGTKAVLAGTGVALAFHVAGLRDFETIGSVSGGSIPAAVFASGAEPREFLQEVVDSDIESLLTPRVRLHKRIYAMLRKYHLEKVRPRRGAYTTRKLRRYMNRLVPKWPEKFWTIASCSHGQVLFTPIGVYKFTGTPAINGRVLADRPPSVGLAVCASCAIPGLIDSTKYGGELLFDGALSGDGEVPVDAVERYFKQGDEQTLILAVDVGEDPIKRARWLRALWNLFCGGWCETGIDGVRPTERPGLLLIKPEVQGFHALQFSLKRDQKWHAVIAGFIAATKVICDNNLVGEDEKERLKWCAEELSDLNKRRKNMPRDLFSHQVEQFMRDHALLPREGN